MQSAYECSVNEFEIIGAIYRYLYFFQLSDLIVQLDFNLDDNLIIF